jgi:hypothetical protein
MLLPIVKIPEKCRLFVILLIDLFHIPKLILKLQIFIQVTSLTTSKMIPRLARAMERTMNLHITILIFADI